MMLFEYALIDRLYHKINSSGGIEEPLPCDLRSPGLLLFKDNKKTLCGPSLKRKVYSNVFCAGNLKS